MNIGTAIGYLELDTSKFQSGLKTAQSQFKGFTDSTNKIDDRFKSLGNSLKTVGSTMTKNVTLPLAALGTGATTVAANFEKGMSQVAATMGMTAEEINGGSEAFESLKQAAMDAGKNTQFSASESAEALNYLALAGYDAEKAIETLPTVLNLAAAGGLELGYASDVMADAMSALGLSTKDAEGFVDQLAKTASKSNTSVAQLGEGIITVGGTAKVLAGGTTELNTALGILADNGIKGAEGGTALRNIILALTPSTDKAVAAFKKLGVETYDANGNLKPINETFAEMEGKLKNLSQEERTRVLSDIFNKVDLKSVNALLANSGERFDELSGYIANADGAASDMAETMNNNLSGQLTLLKSALEGAGISIGNALLPVIKQAVGAINGLVNWFNSLNPSIQTTIVVIGGIAAAIGPVLLIFRNLISLVESAISGFGLIKAALIAFGTTMKSNLLASLISFNTTLSASIIPAITNFASVLGGVILGAIKGVATFLTGTLIPALTATAVSIGAVSVPVWAVIAVFAALVAAGVAVYKNWDVIKAKCVEIWQGSIKPTITNVTNAIKSVVTSAWNGIKSTVSSVSNAIKSVVSSAWNSIKSVITSVLNTIKSIVSSTWNNVRSTTSSILNGIKGVVSSAFNGIVTSISSSLSKAFSTATSWWNKIKNIFSKPISAVVNIFKKEKSLVAPSTENVSTYANSLRARENTVNDFANGMSARTYTMYKNSEIDLKLPTIKTDKSNNSSSERPIEVNLNIDKFVNKSKEDINEIMDQIAFELRKRRISYGGAR